MRIDKVTLANFDAAVAQALQECRAHQKRNNRHAIDLDVAVRALEQIEMERRTHQQRPIGQRSAPFIRYVIDEEPQMIMDPQLKSLIVAIEDFDAQESGL